MTSPEPVPPQAITAVAEALHACEHPEPGCTMSPLPRHVVAAKAALEAAAPHLEAAARERMAAESITAIARYVLSHRDGEARGVTEFVADLLRQGAEGSGT